MPRWLGGFESAGNDKFTKVLLHLDGDASDTARGAAAKMWTNHGPVTFPSAPFAKFGKAGSFGTNLWLDTPGSGDLLIGSQDFTVDFWMRVVSGDGNLRFLYSQNDATGNDVSSLIRVTTGNVLNFVVTSDGVTNTTVAGSRTFLSSENGGNPLWHHVAGVRKNGVMRLFVDGVQDGPDVSANFSVNPSFRNFAIGRPGMQNSNYFSGQIDEFRFSIGIARWFSTFTPPVRAYLPT